MFKKLRPSLITLFVIALGVGGVLSGMFMTTTVMALTKDRYADLQMFTKVLNLVEQHYVEEVDTKKLIYGGIKGMLSSLDPHTNFLPPDIFHDFKEETSGEFGGVGIEIGMQDEVLTVVSPIEDTPAWKAGIKAGDKIVEIEGKSTKGVSLVEAVSKMRGKKGSPANITIWREGFEKPKKFSIMRDIIKVKSVKYTDLDDGYAYTRVTSFIERTGPDLHEVLNRHEKQHGPLKGLILDLRNNPGGLLDQAVNVADEFIEEGPIVSTIGRNKKDKVVEYAKKEGTRTGFPIIVLVNEYSASASEIVAGALQDSKRALIMGTRTFGKGSVQSVVDLGEGAGLKLTVARYYTPSGKSIQGHGIDPDIPVENVDVEAFQKAIIQRKATREADIEGHLIGENEKTEEKNTQSDDDGETPFYKIIPVKNKKQSDETPQEKETREKAEDAKLSPKEKLIKRDFQVSQAFNYLRSWGVFKKYTVPDSKAAANDNNSATADATPENTMQALPSATPAPKGSGAGKKLAPKKPVKPEASPAASPAAKSGAGVKPPAAAKAKLKGGPQTPAPGAAAKSKGAATVAASPTPDQKLPEKKK